MDGSKQLGTDNMTMVCNLCGLTMTELGNKNRPPVAHVHEMVPVVDLNAFRRRRELTQKGAAGTVKGNKET